MALAAVQEEVPETYSDIDSTSLRQPSTDSAGKHKSVGKSDAFRTCWVALRVDDDEPEVDTRSDLKTRLPIHKAGPDNFSPLHVESQSSTKTIKPRLTLSAFRGPAANLTRTDPSRKLQDFYDLDRSGYSGVLGHGAFSTVRLGLRRCDSIPVAVKSIAKHEALRSRRLRSGKHLEEWEILRKMKGHQYIVQLLDVFETDEEIQLIMEYCEGGELFNAIQRKRNRSYALRRGQYNEQQAACIINQILRALCDLHDAGIVHRDVKPENILLASDDENSVRVKLCDFGVARSILQTDKNHSRLQEDGSPLTPEVSKPCGAIGGCSYIAPELIYGSSYDTAVDMYSLGVTLYIVLCGFPPIFSGADADQVIFPNSYWKDVSEDAKNLARRMLDPDASMRITAHEALRDRWIWKHRKSIAQALSPASSSCRFVQINSTGIMNLDVLRHRLSKKKTKRNERHSSPEDLLLSPKRQRLVNSTTGASSAILALADLYRDVAQSPSANVISSVVNHKAMDSGASFKRSPFPTLSV